MERSLQALQGGGSSAASEGGHEDPNAKISWSQTLEDLELVFLFETAVTSKDVKDKVSSSYDSILHFTFDAYISTAD
jgi:hypothetical protein